MDKQNLFTTGEMAKACRTTKDTLYFYERKGLIKPVLVDSNGYRYYDLENYYRMDMIAMLRESGSTVKEISRFIENLTPETYLQYMRLKKEFFRQKQIEYKLLEEKIQRSVELTEQSFSMCCCTPQVETQPEKYLILWESKNYDNDHDTISAFCHLRQFCAEQNIPFDFHLSAMISQQRLTSAGPDRFENDYYYITAHEPIQSRCTHIKPEGRYLTFIHRGSYTDIGRSYLAAFDYIREHDLHINGNSYEKSIVSYFNCNDRDQYVTKVSIKIK